ncbi:MAG: hypothetical protein Q4D93_05390 [Porphyromonas sp.]|nr:hypothetical protein [Porphyromonas sp.]
MKLQNSYDSLLVETEKNKRDLNEVLNIIMEVEDDIQKVNEAENRIRVGSATGELQPSDLDNLKDDIRFLTETLDKNREELNRQNELLKKRDINISALTKKINTLQDQIKQKETIISQLENEIANRDLQLKEKDAQIEDLNETQEAQQVTIELQDKQLEAQEAQLYTVYYCFGTMSELKEQRILSGGGLFSSLKVLPEGFNKDYFLQIDKRKVTSIALFAPRARVRTDHPASSYEFVKDSEGNMSLEILDPEAFWSLGRYLVIEVNP